MRTSLHHICIMFALLNIIYPVFGWLRRTLLILCRYVLRKFPILREFSSRLPLPWCKTGGNEAGLSGEDKPPEIRYSDDDEEEKGSFCEEAGDSSAVCAPQTPCEWSPHRDAEEHRVEPTDELYCEYDSTWETEPDTWGSRRTSQSAAIRNEKFRRFENAARDMQNYRHNYPRLNRTQYHRNPAPDKKPNLSFYLGRTPSLPDGVFIQDFHSKWHGDYDSLEHVHTFIQWLFPLQEPGVNYEASTLTKEEIEEFRESSLAKDNLLKSYKLMLDFYGIELEDETTGKVKRAKNWRARFDNLNSRTHNNLRITRILKCLGTLGFPHYQAPLVHFFLNETLVNRELPRVKDSVLNYFVFAVLDKIKRRELISFAYQHYVPREEFVWCPRKIQMSLSR